MNGKSIDDIISNVSQQQNYMKSLSKITGNIMSIDMPLFKGRMSEIADCEKIIITKLNSIKCKSEELMPIANDYIAKSAELNISSKCTEMRKRKVGKKSKKPKPAIEVVSDMYLPQKLIKSDWFKHIKHFEKQSNKLIEDLKINVEKPLESELNEVYKDNSTYRDIKSFFGVVIEKQLEIEALIAIKSESNKIISILLLPMYNVKHTIEKNWSKIERIFKMESFKHNDFATPENVMKMIEQFIVAKYRVAITDNQKHYMKLFTDLIGDETIAETDGARFMEIMESIDVDKLNKNATVYKFANAAKAVMRKMNDSKNNENDSVQTTEELMNEIQSMLNLSAEAPKNAEDVAAENTTENADIFDN